MGHCQRGSWALELTMKKFFISKHEKCLQKIDRPGFSILPKVSEQTSGVLRVSQLTSCLASSNRDSLSSASDSWKDKLWVLFMNSWSDLDTPWMPRLFELMGFFIRNYSIAFGLRGTSSYSTM